MAKKYYILHNGEIKETNRVKWLDFVMNIDDIEDLILEKTVSQNEKSMVSTMFFGDGNAYRTSYFQGRKQPIHLFSDTKEKAEENHTAFVNLMISDEEGD